MKKINGKSVELDLRLLRDEVFVLVSKGRECFSDCNKKEKRDLVKNYLISHQTSFNEIRQNLLEEEDIVNNFNSEYKVDLKQDEYYQYSDSEIDRLFIDYIFNNDDRICLIFSDSFIEYMEDYFVYLFDRELDIIKSVGNDYDFYPSFYNFSMEGV